MLAYFLVVLILSSITAVLWYFLGIKNIYNYKFIIISIIGSLILSIMIYGIGYSNKIIDQEIYNGEVTGKEKIRVSCEHSYSCNCRESCSGSGSNRSCSTTCDTCYEHSYDVDWRVKTTVKEFNIQRIDRQGTQEPPRWTKVTIGQPTAFVYKFTNYIMGVDASLFNFNNNVNTSLDKYVPAYPLNVYDYHYLDRVLPVNIPANQIKDLDKWNYQLALKLRKLGPQKQCNIIIMLVKLDDPNFEYNVKKMWLGGKKNDIIVMLGIPNYPETEISWVRILSWTDREDFKVNLRDALFDLKNLEMNSVLNVIEEHVSKNFVRKRMRDFEYLKYEIQLSDELYIFGILIGPLLISIFSVFLLFQYKKNQRRSIFNGRFSSSKFR